MRVAKSHYFDLELTVNGKPVRRRIPTHLRLLDFIRQDLGLTGTKEVCGEGECGACTVLLDGLTVDACLILAVEAHHSELTTIEGVSRDGSLTPLQQAFIDFHSVQCGYCIPGMILSGEQILRNRKEFTREEIRRDLSGNICRCTGYQKIVDAIESVGREQNK